MTTQQRRRLDTFFIRTGGDYFTTEMIIHEANGNTQYQDTVINPVQSYLDSKDATQFLDARKHTAGYGFFLEDEHGRYWKLIPTSHIKVMEIPQVLAPFEMQVFGNGKRGVVLTETMLAKAHSTRTIEDISRRSDVHSPAEVIEGITKEQAEDYMDAELRQHGLASNMVSNNIFLLGPDERFPLEAKDGQRYLPVCIDYGTISLLDGVDLTEAIRSARNSDYARLIESYYQRLEAEGAQHFLRPQEVEARLKQVETSVSADSFLTARDLSYVPPESKNMWDIFT